MNKSFKVEERHIEEAKKLLTNENAFKGECCPIALAAKEFFQADVSVGYTALRTYGELFYFYEYINVDECLLFMKHFDGKNYDCLKPFTVELN